MPSVWSAWWWVMKISVSVQPRRSSGGFDGAGVGRVDRGGLAGRLVVHEIADIVLAAEEDFDDQSPWCFLPACGLRHSIGVGEEALR